MDLSQSTIAVTGATGFLGSHIALGLLKRGAKVRGVVRSPHKGAWLAQEGVQFKQADLMDLEALTEAFQGVDAVISNAALFTMQRTTWEEFYRPNKVGTENVYSALQAAKVRRVVQVSTIGVYKPKLCGVTDENSPRLTEKHRYFNWNYAVTKALSENIAWEAAEEYGLDLTVVRPGPIYGPRDRNMTPVFERLMEWPIMLAPTFGLPAVHAGDVAEAIINSLVNENTIGKAYNAAGAPVSIGRFMRTWKHVTGGGPTLLPIWTPIKLRIDISSAQRDLGFKNRPLDVGLADTLAK